MEEEKNIERGLLLVDKEEETANTTPLLVFSVFIIVSSSFAFGVAAGYTADTMSSIMTDLDLSLAQNIVCLDLGRFLVGIGIGLISYVVPVYVAEITPKHARGAFTFSSQLSQNCGVAIAYYFGNFLSWRTLAFIGSIPCWIQVIGLFFVPESPRWLARKGRDKEVEVVLQKLRGKSYDIVHEAREIKVSVELSKQNSNMGFRSLFKKRYARQLTIGIGLMILQQLSGISGIGAYGSTLFKLAGFPVTIGMTVLSLVVTSAFGLCLSSLTLAFAFGVRDVPRLQDITSVFAFIGILSFTMMFAVGMGALPWIIMSEIFPMDIKVVAGSLVTITNWFTGWIANYAFNFMFVWSPTGTFVISGIICGLTIIFTWCLVPETRGLALEEIQRSFANV